MKLYTILGGAALLAGLAYGCSHKKESHDTLTYLKVYSTEAARHLGDVIVPNNLESISNSAHDVHYQNFGRAAKTLDQIDFSTNTQPRLNKDAKSAFTKDAYNATKDLDQAAENIDLYGEHIIHGIKNAFK